MPPVLRPYQRAAVDAALASLRKKKNGIIVAPTGSGKSLLVASIAKEAGGRTIVLQPTKEILEQNKAKMEAFGCRDIGVYSASCGRKDVGQVTFATIGSVVKRPEVFKDFDRIIVDEAHGVNSKGGMYEKFIKELGLQTIGLTATPYRMRSYNHYSGNRVAESRILTRTRPRIFSDMLHVTQVGELFEQGHLCPLQYQCVDGYDAAEIRSNSTGQDFDESALKQYNEAKGIVDKIVASVRMSQARHLLVFTMFRAESARVLDQLGRYGISCAEVSGETPKRDRERILADFKAGRIRCVVNVAVLTVGFDFPALDCIVIGRPTKSVALFYQIVGRGIRPSPGKDGCRLIDLCDNVRRFGRIETFELFDQNGNGMWRLESNAGFLTGADVTTGENLETFVKKPKDKADGGTKVTFGKYKDKPLSEVPLDYLEWGVGALDNKMWRGRFAKEIKRRGTEVAL